MDKKLDAEEIISQMMAQLDESEHIKAYIDGHIKASKGKLTDKHVESAVNNGKEMLAKFKPVILNMVNVINDPQAREELLKKIEDGVVQPPKEE